MGQPLPLILAQADEAGYRMEIVNGLGVWEAMPTLRHIEAARRVEDTFRPSGDERVYRELYVRFPDDSFRRPDVAIYRREPDEKDEAVALLPEAVVEIVSRRSERKDLELSPPFYLAQGVKDVAVFDPYTGIVWHHRTDRMVERHQSPVDLSSRCGCLVTVQSPGPPSPGGGKGLFVEVVLSPERARFVRRLVGEGRFDAPSSAVEAALGILESSLAGCPRQRAVATGLEQVLAGRSGALSVDEVIRRAMRRGALP